MKYFSPNHDMVINASGGYRVLENLGFVSENAVKVKEQSETRAEKIRSWVAENCCSACKRKSDLCVCENKNGEDEMAKKSLIETVLTGSRNDLMLKVKSMNVKNFRVLNKAELLEIVNGAETDRIEEIVDGAVARWKAGWKK